MRRRRYKRNPALLIINPEDDQRVEENVAARERRITLDDLYDYLADDEDALDELDCAIDKFEEFHGCAPREVIVMEVPMGGQSEVSVLVGMGRAPAESYDARDVEGSSKRDTVYVHQYAEDGGDQPLKAVTADGRMVVTLPGSYRVSDWMRG